MRGGGFCVVNLLVEQLFATQDSLPEQDPCEMWKHLVRRLEVVVHSTQTICNATKPK